MHHFHPGAGFPPSYPGLVGGPWPAGAMPGPMPGAAPQSSQPAAADNAAAATAAPPKPPKKSYHGKGKVVWHYVYPGDQPKIADGHIDEEGKDLAGFLSFKR